MASNTNFNPANVSEFEKTKLNKDAHGVATTVTAGTTANLDYTIADDMLISGGHSLLVRGGHQGDTISFQVVHPVAGVLLQFVTDWYVNPDVTAQQVPTSNYPAKLSTGLILRLVYTSTGTSDVWVASNYNLEKVLE